MKSSDFRHFYDQHFERVYRFVFFRVGNNRNVAEDLTSEIFVKALKAFANFDPDRSQVAWIMTIARNHVINHWRDTKEEVDVEEVDFFLEGEDGRKTAVVNDDIARLREALKKLSKKDQRLVEMKYLLGYRYKEMAEEVGKSAGAVRVETHRAMKKLKSKLEKLYAEA